MDNKPTTTQQIVGERQAQQFAKDISAEVVNYISRNLKELGEYKNGHFTINTEDRRHKARVEEIKTIAKEGFAYNFNKRMETLGCPIRLQYNRAQGTEQGYFALIGGARDVYQLNLSTTSKPHPLIIKAAELTGAPVDVQNEWIKNLKDMEQTINTVVDELINTIQKGEVSEELATSEAKRQMIRTTAGLIGTVASAATLSGGICLAVLLHSNLGMHLGIQTAVLGTVLSVMLAIIISEIMRQETMASAEHQAFAIKISALLNDYTPEKEAATKPTAQPVSSTTLDTPPTVGHIHLEPVYGAPQPLNITKEQTQKALESHPEIKTLFTLASKLTALKDGLDKQVEEHNKQRGGQGT